MRARSVALLMLALGCGLVASIGITQVISNRDSEPAESTGDTSEVFVALEEIPFGEPLTPQLLRLEKWPKDKMPAGAMARIEDIEGRRVRAKLYPGEPVLENKLFPKGASDQGYSTVIPKGFRVVAVKVDKVSGSGLILPGDNVDVLVHLIRNPARGILKTSTRTILQDVKVFAVNDVVETEGQDEKTITAQTISLLVRPEHAQLVMLAEELGKIRLIMRSPEDDEVTTVEDTTPSELLDGSEAGASPGQDALAAADGGQSAGGGPGFLQFLDQLRSKKAQPQPMTMGSAQALPGEQHRMRIVSGTEVRDVVLQKSPAESGSGSGVEMWTLNEWAAPMARVDQPGGAAAPAEPPADQDQAPKEEEKPQPPPQEESD